MRKRWFSALVIAACAAAGAARAADHRDGPAAVTDPTTDITDVYAWMSADANKVYLVMDLQGGPMGATAMTKFSNTALYAFHLNSGSKFGESKKDHLIICQFDTQATQKFQCWAPGNEYVTGDTGVAAGATSASGKFRVFAGVRNDPFYFNIRGFRAVATTVKNAAGTLMFDKAGCPQIDLAIKTLIDMTLKSDGGAGMGKDDFAKDGEPFPMVKTNGNVLSIVVAIDKSVVATDGGMLSVWGSTNRK